ncbi:MAG: 16S rRNA (cytosine(967)-C(5))-methyltransferase RsmB [Lachnospiraceae bacterium]|nr:16S rRNA (cytosine(967)-C(5))-methyltransferase RsmB [Lachnospiraceae bacterium]
MTSDVNVRLLALETLLAVTKEGQYSHIVLGQTLEKYQYLSKQERSFLTRLCEGTLEQMLRIDYVLNQFSNVKVNKMKPVIRCILRCGVYELLFMDKVPPQAACNEAVKLTQKKGFSNLKGFVNGVLRNISRNKDRIVWPDPKEEPLSWLSVNYSMPEWILEEWVLQYGMEQTREILEAFLAPSPTCIRVNTGRITRAQLMERLEQEGVTVHENPLVPESLFLTEYDFLGRIPSFQEGLFYVQDTSSMLAVQAAGSLLMEEREAARSAGSRPMEEREAARSAGSLRGGDDRAAGPMRVLDVCGAPGGKSVCLAQLLGEESLVEARDLTEGKVELIRRNIARCRLPNIRAQVKDARIFYPEDEKTADLVLADLPCSGLGVIGRKPDIKYRMTREQIKELAALQREMLHTVCAYVRPGGILLYSTCTISQRENEENVEWFLKEHPDFSLKEQRQLLPKAGLMDGFFYGAMRRAEEGVL